MTGESSIARIDRTQFYRARSVLTLSQAGGAGCLGLRAGTNTVSSRTLPVEATLPQSVVAEAALHCAHRATTASSWGLCEQEGHLATPRTSTRLESECRGHSPAD